MSVCSICGMDNKFDGGSKPSENMVNCKVCSATVHLTCLRNSKSDVCACAIGKGLKSIDFIKISDYLRIKDLSFKEFLNYPQNIPHIMAWNVEKIETFFKAIGFVKEASEFSKRNIDGIKLLKLSEVELTETFKFRLNRASNIYKHIKVLRWKVLYSRMVTQPSVVLYNT